MKAEAPWFRGCCFFLPMFTFLEIRSSLLCEDGKQKWDWKTEGQQTNPMMIQMTRNLGQESSQDKCRIFSWGDTVGIWVPSTVSMPFHALRHGAYWGSHGSQQGERNPSTHRQCLLSASWLLKTACWVNSKKRSHLPRVNIKCQKIVSPKTWRQQG